MVCSNLCTCAKSNARHLPAKLKEGQLQCRQLVELQKDLKSSTEGMLSSSNSAKEAAAGAEQSHAGGSHFTRDMYSLDTTQCHTRATGIPL